jgi:hypothetical protein
MIEPEKQSGFRFFCASVEREQSFKVFSKEIKIERGYKCIRAQRRFMKNLPNQESEANEM